MAERARYAVDEGTDETVSEYAEHWLQERKRRGVGTVGHDRGRLGKHVLPLIGHLDARTFGREDVERVVEDLDRKILLDVGHEDHLSWKTASNVWVLVSRMCKDMVDAKRRDLRVRDDYPTARVRLPSGGKRPAKQYLYPSEFLRLVECKAIDVALRTLYAVAVYTYARSNELAALTWDDVDLEHSVIHITKSIDRETRKVKGTKTGTTRRIPIEPGLAPVLARLRAESANARGKRAKNVLWMPDHEDRAILLRQHLQTAQVTRAELFDSDAQRKHVTFHDLRATGITWCAVRGDDPLRIKQRAHHVAQPASRLLPDLSAAGDEQFVARPACLLVDFSFRPVAPPAFDAHLVGQGLDPLGVRVPSVVALCCLMENDTPRARSPPRRTSPRRRPTSCTSTRRSVSVGAVS